MGVEFKKNGVIAASGDVINENLLRGSYEVGASNFPGWINNGDTTLIEKVDDGSVHWFGNILESHSYRIPSIVMNCNASCEFNSTYIYTMDLKFDREVKTTGSTPSHFHYGARNTDSIFNNSMNGNLTARSVVCLTATSAIIPANTWFRSQYKFIFGTGATSEGYIYPAIRPFVYGAVLTTNEEGTMNGWVRNVKIEKGTIGTVWTPHPEDIGNMNPPHGMIERSIVTPPSSIYEGHIEAVEFIEI